MLSPSTLEQLKLSRFLTVKGQPSVGYGERRSRKRGGGLEFVDHRPYREGDDVRYLDALIRARLGENYIRQFTVEQRLPIYILLDGTASMQYGNPDKFRFSQELVKALAFIGLSGGDQVQIGNYSRSRLAWSPTVHGLSRTRQLFDWIDSREPGGQGSFTEALQMSKRHIRRASLIILISDWWTEDPTLEIDALTARSSEILSFHVCAPEELDLGRLEGGILEVLDIENGEEVKLTVDAGTSERYKDALAAWEAYLGDTFSKCEARYFPLSSSTDIAYLCTQKLRAEGVIT